MASKNYCGILITINKGSKNVNFTVFVSEAALKAYTLPGASTKFPGGALSKYFVLNN
jgi:hypothetical protein